MMVNKTRIGILGAGSVVEQYHLPVLLSTPGVVIEWLCDQSERRARDLAGRFGIRRVFQSLDSCSDVDIVLIAIPVGYRLEVVRACAERGWHMFCEKPFAISLQEHETFISEARSQSVQIGVGLMRRFYQASQSAKRLLAERPFGRVVSVWAGEGGRLRATGRDGTWYQTLAGAAGGGILMETGSHLVDQMFFALGVEKFSIRDCRQMASDGIDHETSITGVITLGEEGDVPFGLTVSRLTDLFNGIEVRCANATVTVGVTPESNIEVKTDSGKMIGVFDGGHAGPGAVYRAFYCEWAAFLAQCLSGLASEVDAETSRLSTELIERAYRQGRLVDVAPISGSQKGGETVCESL